MNAEQGKFEPLSGPSDMLLKGGTVVDGTGAPAFRADVRLREAQIAEVGQGCRRRCMSCTSS